MMASRHMRSMTRLILLAAAALAVLLATPAAGAQGEPNHEEEFSYVPGAENGPENWGKINVKWATCGTGRMQSPVDLARERVTVMRSLGYLNSSSYHPTQASVINRGHDVEVKFEGDAAAGAVVINGTAYYLRRMHWHWPSEHTVDGRRYDMELHLVHDDGHSNIAVVGLLYVIGGPDGFLHTLEPAIRRIAGKKNMSEPVGVVDPRLANCKDSMYYRYMGSLTTPPCTQGVVWTIVKRVRTVAEYQLDLLREAVVDDKEHNARPIQELNDRNIGIFIP